MILTIALALLFGRWGSAQENNQPLVSATNPAYLGCSVWTIKGWTSPSTRSARTTLIRSVKGFRAYAEVKAVFKDDSCENITTLYVASSASQKFKVVYEKLPSETSGNGIRLVGWSPSGDKLLAQVNLWDHDSDSGYSRLALIYDTSTDSAQEIRPLDDALSHVFGTACEFDIKIAGWRTNQKILVKVSRTPPTDEYEQQFCVKQARMFVYDLQKGTLQALRPQSP